MADIWLMTHSVMMHTLRISDELLAFVEDAEADELILLPFDLDCLSRRGNQKQ